MKRKLKEDILLEAIIPPTNFSITQRRADLEKVLFLSFTLASVKLIPERDCTSPLYNVIYLLISAVPRLYCFIIELTLTSYKLYLLHTYTHILMNASKYLHYSGNYTNTYKVRYACANRKPLSIMFHFSQSLPKL